MAIAKKIASLIVGFFTIYSTPKVVQVQNQKIAVINRIIQLLIFAYVLGFMIIYKVLCLQKQFAFLFFKSLSF